MSTDVSASPLARATIPVGLLLVVGVLFDSGARLLPLRPDVAQWRLGAEVAFLSGAPLVVLGVAIVAIGAWWDERPLWSRLAAIAAIGYAVALLLALAAFVYDAAGLIPSVAPEVRTQLRVRLPAVGVTTLLAVTACAFVGIGSWRAGRDGDSVVRRAVRTRDARQEPPPLIGSV